MRAKFSCGIASDEIHGEVGSDGGQIFEISDGGNILFSFLKESGQNLKLFSIQLSLFEAK